MSKLPSITGEFVLLVQEYRRAENAYLQESSRPKLEEVRRLRRLVDSMLVRWQERVDLFLQIERQFGLEDAPKVEGRGY